MNDNAQIAAALFHTATQAGIRFPAPQHETAPGGTVLPVNPAAVSLGVEVISFPQETDQGLNRTPSPDTPKPVVHGSRARSPRGSIYDQITKRMTDLLEAGTVPWHKPWKAQTALPRNLISKRPYRGINVLLLLAAQYESPFWLTFLQAQQVGGRIRQGERASPVVFWKKFTIEDKETGESKAARLLRYYHVFNLAQCEGLAEVAQNSQHLGTLTLPADVVKDMPKRPAIRHGMAAAFYSPEEDLVGMPYPERFTKPEEYHSTLFHELVHSTGHKSRLNRPTLASETGFGSDPYCKEELVAEMGAAFLCAHAGIVERTVENSAAYIKGWLGRLKSDKTLVIHAAGQAQLAADFILETKPEETPPALIASPQNSFQHDAPMSEASETEI